MKLETAIKKYMYGDNWREHQEHERAFGCGWEAALKAVQCVLGGCSPVDRNKHPDLAHQVESIGERVQALLDGKDPYELDQRSSRVGEYGSKQPAPYLGPTCDQIKQKIQHIQDAQGGLIQPTRIK